MQIESPFLIIEINKLNFIFIVGKKDDENNFHLIEEIKIPISGINENKITELNSIINLIKENIFFIENKIDFTFKETIIILNNFECSLLNFSGFKKLNGMQLTKENITYILNSLKSKVDEIEKEKKILHIFNSKYLLDKKNVENLPIGLFGDFYSQELSFFLINKNDHKNLLNIFNTCNLKIKRIIYKGFIEGVELIKNNANLESFFQIKIEENNSQIIFFENSAIKYVQDFNFGSNIIIKDISKVTAMKIDIIKNFLINFDIARDLKGNEFLEKEYFKNDNFRKVKKKLILEVAAARIKEISDVILFKNINIVNFLKKKSPLYLNISDQAHLINFKNYFLEYFSEEKKVEVNFLENNDIINIYQNAMKLVQFGWKKEAVPIIHEKKSLVSRFFDFFFK
tara:strand:- start:119 stop:1315 length:1197 start_codon:yes stop_codon:yes gene_type:complete